MSFRIVKLLDPIQNIVITGGIVPKGAYSAGTDYAVGDMVDYNGSSYVMYVDAAAGTAPTDNTKWGLVAEKGDTGATGDAGATGAQGDAGVGVPTGGTTGQVLAKTSNTNYDTGWVDNTGGSGISESLAIAYSVAL